jgi:phosphoribosylaminoimidazolecarboxamide formyltransferase/IMP cyclohydrolase
MDLKVQNAIISVSDKTGLEELSRKLHDMGVNIYSTGGTARAIESYGVPVTLISEYTGFPEILGGRVKSLHPRIHGGILAVRDNQEHMDQMEANGVKPFDLIVINLYPFQQVISKPDTTVEKAIENIDIGGPSMLRSAAKNYRYVAVVTDPSLYGGVLGELEQRGSISLETRQQLAMKVFETTSFYDGLIASYFHSNINRTEAFPESIGIFYPRKQELRYGENPHQKAAFYANDIGVSGVAGARQLHGKELSFNNILDIEAALEIVKDFDRPACSIIKHTNPCGAATADSLGQAFTDALACDPVSAFGSIVGCNREVDGAAARTMLDNADFLECIIAPGFTDEAFDILRSKKNLRILDAGSIDEKPESYDYDLKRVIGGVLLQTRDLQDAAPGDLETATKSRVPDELDEVLKFAWKIVKHVKSNAIVLARKTDTGAATVGIGAGQMSRVDSTFMAISKAGDRAKGSVLGSDAFFPKADAVELAAKSGISAIIQPGGSIRDEEVVQACDKAGIPMVVTGIRHFKH